MNNQRPINGLNNTGLLAIFELKKSLFNPKGVMALAAFSLVWLLILVYPIKSASLILLDPTYKDLLNGLLGISALDELFNWPVAEMAVYWVIALYLFPMFSIIIAADQFASDKARGTLRFLVQKAGRNSVFFGRFCGAMLIQMLLVLLTVIATVCLSIYRDPNLFLSAIYSGFFVALNLTIILLPYTALMSLFSLIANSARQATIYAVLFGAVSYILLLVLTNIDPVLAEIKWLLPGAQLDLVMNTQGIDGLKYAAIPIMQTLALLFLGKLYMNRNPL